MARQGTKRRPATSLWRRRIGGLCAAIAVVGLVQVTGFPGLPNAGLSGISDAQAARTRREKPKTRASKTVGKKVGEALLKAREALEVDNNAEALAILNRLLNSDMKDYERAVVLRMVGTVYSNMSDYKRAISMFEQAYQMNALDEQGQADLLYYLGQLYLAEDRVDDAIRSLETWFAQAGDAASPQAFFTLASAYAMKEDYKKAHELAEQGLAKARLQEDLRENWFRFAAGMRYQNQKVKEMQTLLREMVGLFPGKSQYWSQLSSTYSLLGDDQTSYYFRIMMYIQDMLVKSNDLASLGAVHIFQETPIRGVRVLEKAFADGLLEKKDKNYETLSIAYQEAREWKKSIKPLGIAAGLSEDGDLYIRLCQSYLFDREYAKAENACRKGIDKKELRDPGGAWMLLGTAQYSRGKLEAARKSFVNASRYEKNEKNSQRWINFLDQEIRRANAKKAASGS